ncbi:MAG: hypothetical protein C5B48_14875 [Candidatus Rokuibacteriota bacterium]|nr:MAG: hypothetical protein C5B48_14875 [Candidatus Rokubacteria bacterium]
MRRLLWPLSAVVAFGLGLAAGNLPRLVQSPTQEVERLRAEESRLRQQVSTLQARLRTSEARVPGREIAAASFEPDRSGAALAPDGRGRREWPTRRGSHGERPYDLSSSGSAAPKAGSAAPKAPIAPGTVEAALDRFYRYLDEVKGPGGAGRWQRTRQVADDLRAMGDVGAEALLKVLSAGTSTDERRAAAQLLGDLQAQRALPLLQDILDKDSDVLLRRAAASAMRRLQTPDSIPTMEGLMANAGEDRFVRMSAAYGLAQQGRPQGVTGLVQIFDESNADGRGRDMAFRALASLDDDRTLSFMRRLLTSGAEVSYRLQAIRYLTAQGDQQALGPLQQLMQSPTEQPSIRDAAAQAHATLAGR